VHNQYQPDTKSNLNPNPNCTTEHHAVVSIQVDIITCPTYLEKFIRNDVILRFLLLSVVVVTLQTELVAARRRR